MAKKDWKLSEAFKRPRMQTAAAVAGVPFGRETCIRIWKGLGHKRCAYCCSTLTAKQGLPNTLTLDYIVPKRDGGINVFQNSLLCCMTCKKTRAEEDVSRFAHKNNLPRKDWLFKKNQDAKANLRRMRNISRYVISHRSPNKQEMNLIFPCPKTRDHIRSLALPERELEPSHG